jgi:PAS domain S-box-containing protein
VNRFHYRSVAWALAILVPGLVATGYLTRHAFLNAKAEAREEFDANCREIQVRIDRRMAAHEQILRSSAAFFADEDGITRSEFYNYAKRQKINQTLPGIQGLGFAALVPRAELEQHLQKIRAEGFPTYRIWPEGDREIYTSIIYLDPFADRNLRAFGYDMFTEPVRRAAMERARDLDEIALSGKVQLVQEDGQNVQAGTLMYAPVYRLHPAPVTVAERHAAFLGWIYSPYRMGDLMSAGILGSTDPMARRKIRLEIFDGETATPAALLCASQPQGGPAPAGAEPPAHDAVVEHAGRPWLLRFTAVGGTGALADFRWAWLLGGSGTLSSVLLAGLAFSLASTRVAARRQAARLTADLRQSEELWRFALEGTCEGVWDWKVPTNEVYFSPRWKELLGSPDEIGNSLDEWSKRVHPDDLPHAMAEVQAHFDGHTAAYADEHRMRRKDGSWIWILDRGLVVSRDADGQPLRMIGTDSDITERKQAEAQMRWKNALLEAQLEATTDGILVVDEKGKKIMQNRQCAELLKIPKDLADNQDDRPQLDFVKDRTKDPDQFVAKVRYLYSHPDETSRDEVEFKDGTILARYSAPVVGKDGTNFGRIWAFRDVTVHKRTEEEQLRSRRAAFNLMTDAIEARVRLEQASKVLRASEEKHRTLVENLSSGIVIHHPDSSIQFANAAAVAMLGLSEDQLLGKSAMDPRWCFLQEDGSTMPLEAYPVMRVIAAGEGFRDLILGICRPDLTAPIWVFGNGYPERHEDGQLKQVVVTFVDITARRQAEEALRHSEERLQLVMLGSQLGYWDRNLETGQVVRNARWAEMLGYGLNELEFTVKQWADFVHPDDLAVVEQSIQDHLAGRTPMHRMEYRMRAKDGSSKWILDQAQVVKRDAAGRPLRMSGTHTDVSERKYAEADLQKMQGLLRQAEKLGRVGAWEFDVDSELQTWTETLYDIHELDIDLTVHLTVNQGENFYTPASRPIIERAVRHAIEQGESFDLELEIITAKGNLRTVHVIGRADLAHRKVAGFLQDITARKQAELEIHQLNQTLEERVVERTAELAAANAELEAFSYSVSHDLRAPLRAMDGFSAALLEDCAGKLDETAEDHLRRIRAGSQRMGMLIDDLLNLSRESRAAMRRTPVDLTALVHEIGADLQAAQPDHCPEWAVAPAMAANADARMVRVVLRNLLGNAWKFTGQRAGARIEVGVLPPEEATRIAPPELVVPGTTVFFVRDNGAGFDMAYAGRLFGAFQRLHSQQEFEGTGIGLALVQRIIRRHGGCIWATGKVNEGATFYFTLGKEREAAHER